MMNQMTNQQCRYCTTMFFPCRTSQKLCNNCQGKNHKKNNTKNIPENANKRLLRKYEGIDLLVNRAIINGEDVDIFRIDRAIVLAKRYNQYE